MTSNLHMRIPDLPANWPYEPRTATHPWTHTENMDLGELGGGWTRVGPEALDLAADSQGLGQAFGRGGIQRRGTVVIRPYRRGGWMHHVNDRTYSSELRFAAEAEAHRALWEQGFPTVEPLGYAFRSHGVGVEGLYLTGYEEAQPWPRVFDRTEKALPQFRMILGALSGWGLWAPDLNATNFILKPEGTLLALDWDRSRWQPPGAALHGAYLRRLMRSLRRLEAPEEIHGLIGSLA